ncbi:hypothetical protein GF325_06005 [Candidatus Bathyarchaeota archaeon]|nr:hypothetical protein [Candidatus Bathyarchaeota archaeon]
MFDIEKKMNAWGPFSPRDAGTLIFSIGNLHEGHGPALSPDNDSRCANFVAYRVSERTGARFMAHVPFTTDRVGDIARDWSPGYLPMDECVRKSVDFINFHVNALKDRGVTLSKILIIVGHGGNKGIENYDDWDALREQHGMESILFASTFTVDLGQVLRCLEPYSEETRMEYLAVKPGHADTMEHSIATLYGGVDMGKYAMMNRFMRNHGVDAALKKWPVIGGLGGYLKFGGDRYEPLRKVGLGSCLKKLEEDGQLFIFKDFAKEVMEISIGNICRMIHPLEDDHL